MIDVKIFCENRRGFNFRRNDVFAAVKWRIFGEYIDRSPHMARRNSFSISIKPIIRMHIYKFLRFITSLTSSARP